MTPTVSSSTSLACSRGASGMVSHGVSATKRASSSTALPIAIHLPVHRALRGSSRQAPSRRPGFGSIDRRSAVVLRAVERLPAEDLARVREIAVGKGHVVKLARVGARPARFAPLTCDRSAGRITAGGFLDKPRWRCVADRPPHAGLYPYEEMAMHVGLHMFPTEYAIHVGELAREAEARGFESLFLPEHTHIPKSRRSPWAGGPTLPQEYWHTHDPFVALAIAAAATTRLKLATGICLVIERDPIVTAKCVASLDVLSGGRFLFGIGAGWNAEEMENHGTEFKTRFALMGERLRAMKA